MPIYKIQKRNGRIVNFDSNKISAAINEAFKSVNGQYSDQVQMLGTKVYAEAEGRFGDKIPHVEDLQDVVEEILIESGHAHVAKAYILYRQEQSDRRQKKNVVVDVKDTIGEYLAQLDWRVNANSNQGYSLGGLILNTAGKVTANYWLSEVYPQEVGDAHRNADMHIHDLDVFAGYCAGWNLRALLEEGFNGVQNKVESASPKHLSSAVSQMVNFFGTLQNEWAGAQAFSSFDTYLAPFVRKYSEEIKQEISGFDMKFESSEVQRKYIEQRVERYVYQNMQSFVFNLNIPSRWGTQTPFTNLTFDWICPDDLRDDYLLISGEKYKYSFGELEKEMGIINRAFIRVMTEGDANGRTFTFPIPTYNISKDFDWESEDNEMLFEMTAKYGTPYFQNFINSDLNPGDVRSMCCRLQLDLKELRKRGGGLFGSSEMTGSIGVVTINAARIGYLHKGDAEGFYKRLKKLMELAKDSLELKRKEIEKWMDSGLYPYTKRYLPSLRNHFSTIGINGVNEAIRNISDDQLDITSEEGKAFAEKILDYMREVLSEFQEETGHLYNLEATPAEGTTYRFAKEDQRLFSDIIQAGTVDGPYYTNSSQLPVGHTDDVFEALELQDSLQIKYTGGTVLHAYMSERVTDAKVCRSLVKNILTQFRLPYITITPTFSICPKHGYLSGEYEYCPKCDSEIEAMSQSKSKQINN